VNEEAKDRVLAEGELCRRPARKLVRVLLAVTGISFLRALGLFVSTWVLGFRKRGRVFSDGSLLTLEVESSMLGRRVKQTTIHIPVRSVLQVRREDNLGAMPVMGGVFGLLAGLALGFIVLVQWSRTLLGIYIIIGFACVLLGIGVDIFVSFIYPRLGRKSSLSLSTQNEVYTLRGVPDDQIEAFLRTWKTGAF
jgi:hypothetical protein